MRIVVTGFEIVITIISIALETDMAEIAMNFRENRSKYPVMFVIIPKNELNPLFSTPKLTNLILNRLIILAKESYSLLLKQLSSCAFEKNVDFMVRYWYSRLKFEYERYIMSVINA